MAPCRVMVTVTGRVQGVAFRAVCQREASARAVTGWVRNRADGSVEALFEGSKDAVDAMISWCHQGPSAAEVTRVEVVEAPDGPEHRSFSLRF